MGLCFSSKIVTYRSFRKWYFGYNHISKISALRIAVAERMIRISKFAKHLRSLLWSKDNFLKKNHVRIDFFYRVTDRIKVSAYWVRKFFKGRAPTMNVVGSNP